MANGARLGDPGRPTETLVWFVRRVLGPMVKLLFRPKLEGIENLPEGPFVLAANHGAGYGAADIFSFAINTGRSIEQVLVEKHPHFLDLSEQIAEAQKKYEEKKRAANSMDFDDLLEKTLLMLQQNTELAERYQRQFQFILVDEYQDTNRIQADFIDILAKRHGNVMVVGDDAQSIYSWRGANFKNILDFPKRYPNAKVYRIETNYRSVPEILEVANHAIAANIPRP